MLFYEDELLLKQAHSLIYTSELFSRLLFTFLNAHMNFALAVLF